MAGYDTGIVYSPVMWCIQHVCDTTVTLCLDPYFMLLFVMKNAYAKRDKSARGVFVYSRHAFPRSQCKLVGLRIALGYGLRANQGGEVIECVRRGFDAAERLHVD